MKAITLGIAILLLAGCAMQPGEERRVERGGRGAWREELHEGVFVGVSRHGASQAEAIADATLDARRQIAESLGLLIEVESLQETHDTLRAGELQTTLHEDTRARVYANALVEVKPDRVYWEKWMRMTDQGPAYTWKAWVRVPFASQQHRQTWLGFVRRATGTYAAALGALPQDPSPETLPVLMDLLDALLRNEEDFAGQLWLVHEDAYQNFLQVKQDCEARLRGWSGALRLYASAPRSVFAGSFGVAATCHDMPVQGLALHAVAPQLHLDRTAVTDQHGEASIPYRFEDTTNALVSITPGTARMARHMAGVLPERSITLLSPLARGNIGIGVWMFCDPLDTWLEATLCEQLQELGYTTWCGAGDAAYRLEGTLTAREQPRSAQMPDVHVAQTELTLHLLRDSDRKTIWSYTLPNERFFDTRGFGISGEEALCNSQQLRNMGLRDECVRTMVRRIDRAVMEDVQARLR